MFIKSLLLSLLLLISTSACANDADVQYYRSEVFKEKNLPLSDAVRVGKLIFVSGNLGVDFSGKELSIVPGGIEAETRQTMRNIEKSLKSMGSSLDKIVKCTVFLSNMEEWPKLNKIWPSFFKENYPARTAVEVHRLWRGAAIEIECIAHVD